MRDPDLEMVRKHHADDSQEIPCKEREDRDREELQTEDLMKSLSWEGPQGMKELKTRNNWSSKSKSGDVLEVRQERQADRAVYCCLFKDCGFSVEGQLRIGRKDFKQCIVCTIIV